MNIAAGIASFRRERNMTQEMLAERIGVSPQTISKWENAATCPDVTLLPVLADVFGVTIDALYGRAEAHHRITADKAIEQVLEHVRETIVGVIHDQELDGKFEDQLEHFRNVMAADPRNRSVIENDRDVMYFREKLGVMALRKPEEGWNSLFGQTENQRVLSLLADEDFRRAMQVIISRRMLSFTLLSLAKMAQVKEAERLEEKLQNSGLFDKRELLIDEKPLTYYQLTAGEMKLYLVYAVLAFAQELGTYVSQHYCFIGNGQYYTP